MTDERDLFEGFVQRNGTVRVGNVRHFAPTLRPDGGCWTWAWEEAVRRGGRYVEGTCWKANGDRWRAHAWVEIDGPSGVEIVECTEGYEEMVGYLGIAPATSETNDQLGMLDYNLAVALGMATEYVGTRASVIETLIVTRARAER